MIFEGIRSYWYQHKSQLPAVGPQTQKWPSAAALGPDITNMSGTLWQQRPLRSVWPQLYSMTLGLKYILRTCELCAEKLEQSNTVQSDLSGRKKGRRVGGREGGQTKVEKLRQMMKITLKSVFYWVSLLEFLMINSTSFGSMCLRLLFFIMPFIQIIIIWDHLRHTLAISWEQLAIQFQKALRIWHPWEPCQPQEPQVLMTACRERTLEAQLQFQSWSTGVTGILGVI